MPHGQLDCVVGHLRRVAGLSAAQRRTDAELLEQYVATRDEDAFGALVRRYGRLVRSVCRHVLHHEQDIDDAFQVTFLVFATKAATIRSTTSVASWLYGVAYRTAMNAKRVRRRRSEEQREVEGSTTQQPVMEAALRELQAILDDEVHRLSERCRAPFVLCCLEGKSRAEAAVQLGWKEGTVSSRLAEARKILHGRLVRRGVVFSAALCAAESARVAASAAVSAALVRSTIKSARSFVASKKVAADIVSAEVASLAKGVLSSMSMTPLKIATAVLLTASSLAGACVLTGQVLAGKSPAQQGASPLPAPQRSQSTVALPGKTNQATPDANRSDEKTVIFSGRVLDPEGRAVPDAKLIFVYSSVERVPERVWATTSADGAFRFSVSKKIEEAALRGNPWDHTYVVAVAQGYGFAWAQARPDQSSELTLHLVKDDVPIQGRVLDLQGKPVANATVRMEDSLYVPTTATLDSWLEALKTKKQNPNRMDEAVFTSLHSPAFAPLFPPVKTGADGRFRIQGIGPDRVVSLIVEGPEIATQQLKAITRSVDKIQLASPLGGNVTYSGATVDVVAAPTQVILGVVRDKDSGKPLAGVTVRSQRLGGAYDLNGLVRTTTDEDGRYRLVGLPKRSGNAIIAEAYGRLPRASDLPYLAVIKRIEPAPGLEPVHLDLGLKRGVWVTGRVLDKATGKGVQAGFDYFCFLDHPLMAELPQLGHVPADWTQKDGTFRLVALPGRGVIGVRAHEDKYCMGKGAELFKDKLDQGGQLLGTAPYYLYPGNFHTLVEVTPKPEDQFVTCDVVLEPGATLKGTVVGPDGKPVSGVRAAGLRAMAYWEHDPLKDAEFTLFSVSPDEPRLLQMVHEAKKLSGWLLVRGDEQAPVRVRLQPWGTLTGRLVSPDGQPVTNVTIHSGSRVRPNGAPAGSFPQKIDVDKEGRFRVEGLAAGLVYNLVVGKGGSRLAIGNEKTVDLTIEPGETKDLGDLEVKLMD